MEVEEPQTPNRHPHVSYPLSPPWQGKNLREEARRSASSDREPKEQICQPANGRRHGGACGKERTGLLMLVVSCLHGEVPAQPVGASVLLKTRKHGPLSVAPGVCIL